LLSAQNWRSIAGTGSHSFGLPYQAFIDITGDTGSNNFFCAVGESASSLLDALDPLFSVLGLSVWWLIHCAIVFFRKTAQRTKNLLPAQPVEKIENLIWAQMGGAPILGSYQMISVNSCYHLTHDRIFLRCNFLSEKVEKYFWVLCVFSHNFVN
jgi:hypothetical protein